MSEVGSLPHTASGAVVTSGVVRVKRGGSAERSPAEGARLGRPDSAAVKCDGGAWHGHVPLPVPALATRDLRPRKGLDLHHGPIAWCVAPVSPAVRPFLLLAARLAGLSSLPMKPHSAVNEGKRRQAGETRGKKGRTAGEIGATHHAIGP
eukprot:scaffold1054_cov116-Isochrysis_galbana.AAC.9